MQNFGAFGAPCTIHQNSMITGFCTNNLCINRVLCKDCQQDHDKTHNENFKTLLEVLMANFDAEFQELGKVHSDYKSKIEAEFVKVDILIEKLKARMQTLIEEFRLELMEDIKNNMHKTPSLDSIEELYKDLEQRRINAMSEKDKSNFDQVRESFAGKLTQITSIKSDLQYDLESLTKNPLNPDAVDTYNFKKFLKFGIRAPDLTKNQLTWKWNINRKNEYLRISDDQMTAERIDPNSSSYAPVFGDVLLKDGTHRWDIKIETHRESKQYICFGIVEEINSKNLDYMNPKLIIGMNSSGFPFQMKQLIKLESYDEKTFTCLLDFESGTFSILYSKAVICEMKENFKNKFFYPVCILYDFSNTITLMPSQLN